MSTPFNLKSLETVAEKEEEGQWVDIKHPSGEPLYMGGQTEQQLRIRVAGSYSKTYRNVVKLHRDQSMKRRGRLDGDELDRRELSTLAACTLEWTGALDDDGKTIPLTKDNARILYGIRFIADQVDEAIGDHASFFGNGSTS